MRSLVYLFGELEDADVDWLVSVGVRRSISPGAVLMTVGQPSSDLFIVLDGTFAVTITGVTTTEVGRLTRGDIVGEMSFVDGRPPSATVMAVDRAIVLAVPRTEVAAHLSRDPRFAARFYKALVMLLADRLRSAHQRVSGAGLDLSEDVFDVDEVASDTLDTLFLAGQRIERLLEHTSVIP
jgi:CRP-like cAMP-binding protein